MSDFAADTKGSRLIMKIHFVCLLLLTACATGPRTQKTVSEQPPVGVSQEIIHQVIANNMKSFAVCYEKSLSLDQTLEGKMVLDWFIVTGGKVENAKINDTKSEIIDPKLRACMLQKLSALNFPEPVNTNSFAVSYPFAFKDTKQ